MAIFSLCGVDGCGKEACLKGYCSPHYQRLRRHGSPIAGGTSMGAAKRELERVLQSDTDDCVTWRLNRCVAGYGRMRWKGEAKHVHRVVCEVVHGPSDGIRDQVAHSCGKGHLGCVNPRHLRWATRSENQLERASHGTSNRGERCAAAKLTRDQVIEIRKRLDAGESCLSIATAYSVSFASIYDIREGRSWAWLFNEAA